jgi:hypothetical protein
MGSLFRLASIQIFEGILCGVWRETRGVDARAARLQWCQGAKVPRYRYGEAEASNLLT